MVKSCAGCREPVAPSRQGMTQPTARHAEGRRALPLPASLPPAQTRGDLTLSLPPLPAPSIPWITHRVEGRIALPSPAAGSGQLGAGRGLVRRLAGALHRLGAGLVPENRHSATGPVHALVSAYLPPPSGRATQWVRWRWCAPGPGWTAAAAGPRQGAAGSAAWGRAFRARRLVGAVAGPESR